MNLPDLKEARIRTKNPVDVKNFVFDEKYKNIVTIEDGVLKGGMGSAVLEFMSDNGLSPQIKRLGIPDIFVEHGMPYELYEMLGLDSKGIAETLKMIFKNNH